MRLLTQKIDLIGFSRIHEIIMRMKLSEVDLPEGDITIELEQPIEYGKCDFCWYGGLMATVRCNDDEVTVVANGDVIASLIDKKNNEEIAYVKDKSNSGRFDDEMHAYIKNDAHLYEIMKEEDSQYVLNFENNNWFEIFLNKVKGITTGKSYVSDSTNVFDAIAEAAEKMSEGLLPY